MSLPSEVIKKAPHPKKLTIPPPVKSRIRDAVFADSSDQEPSFPWLSWHQFLGRLALILETRGFSVEETLHLQDLVYKIFKPHLSADEQARILAPSKLDIHTTPSAASLIATDEKERQISTMRKALVDIDLFCKRYQALENDYPEEMSVLKRKHPALMESLATGIDFAHQVQSAVGQVSDENLGKSIDAYNQQAAIFNRYIHELGMGADLSDALIHVSVDEIPPVDAQLEAEVRQFAQDVYHEFFPETFVDQFVVWATGQELEGYQKILLAPANGIEGALTGIISLLNPQTYQDLFLSIQTLTGMSWEEYCAAFRTLKLVGKQLKTTDAIAGVISLICSFLFIIGGTSKLVGIAQKLKYSPRLIAFISQLDGIPSMIVRNSARQAKLGQKVDVAILAGLVMPYIPQSKQEK